jgi:hypothetical protein
MRALTAPDGRDSERRGTWARGRGLGCLGALDWDRYAFQDFADGFGGGHSFDLEFRS